MNIKAIMLLIQTLRDEESRKKLILAAVLPVVILLIILTMIVYILASPLMLLNPYFSGNEYAAVQAFKQEYDGVVEGYIDLSFNGIYPLPFDHDGNVRVTDNYGYRIHPITGEYRMHWGIDFGTAHHCEIKSIADGTVSLARVYGTYGNTVIVKHETLAETFYSLYAHLSEIRVVEGQTVTQGEVIGLEGGSASDPNPGSSTGHHLHMAIMDENFRYVNPAGYLFVGE